MSGLRINISKISDGIHPHSLETEPGDIGLDERFNRLVQVKATVEKASRQFLLHVESHSGGVFVCDRCLDEFQRQVDSDYSIVYFPGPSPSGHTGEKQEVQYLAPDVNMIDIGEDVRQFLVLALPLKMLCKEDCAGLCPVCGVNSNKKSCSCRTEDIDERGSDLRRLSGN